MARWKTLAIDEIDCFFIGRADLAVAPEVIKASEKIARRRLVTAKLSACSFLTYLAVAPSGTYEGDTNAYICPNGAVMSPRWSGKNEALCALMAAALNRPDIGSDIQLYWAVLGLIDRLNSDPRVHGILVQLPLPPQFDIYSVLHRIDPRKDVDGFHLYNVGGLVVGERVFSPCTPFGVMKLLEREGIEVSGQNVVIVGASNIVGKPMALMMMRAEATVTICHVKTRDLAQFTILADVLIVAAGVPGLIVKQMVKFGAVVIDVGINRLPSGKIVGDVDYEGVSERASYISPVPGGVGPMTVTMLIHNTIQSAEQKSELVAA